MKSRTVNMVLIINLVILIVFLFITFSGSDVITQKLFNALAIIICANLYRLLSKTAST